MSLSLKARPKLNFIFLLVALAFAAGFYLHFRNLHDVIYIDEDEARPFALLSSGPLIYLMGRPVYDLFETQEAVFYLAAALGFLSIVLFYLLVKLFSDEKTAALAALFYAIWPFRVNYARTLFPAVFTEPYFLLAFLLLLKGLFSKNRFFVLGAGFVGAAALFVHMYSYAADAGLFALFLVFLWQSKEPVYSSREKAQFIGWFAVGGLLSVLLFQNILLIAGHGYNYIMGTIVFGRETSVVAKFPGNAFAELFARMTASPKVIFITLITLIACAFNFTRIALKKDFKALLFVLPYAVGAGILLLLGGLNIHTLFERHFVWLSSLYCWSLAAFFSAAADKRKEWSKMVTAATAAVALILFSQSFQITQETFKISVIRNWLKDHQIENRYLVSAWWPIHDPKNLPPGGRTLSFVPGLFERLDPSNPYPLYGDLNGIYAMRYAIAWPRIYQAYKADLCRYFVTSGMNLRAQIGQNEALLKHVKPVMSWPHPYAVFKTRPYYDAKYPNLKIEVYRLADVFSNLNFYALQKENKKP